MSYFIAGLVARILSMVPWLFPGSITASDWRIMSDHLWGKPVPEEILRDVLYRVEGRKWKSGVDSK